jgi:hypothetical protein
MRHFTGPPDLVGHLDVHVRPLPSGFVVIRPGCAIRVSRAIAPVHAGRHGAVTECRDPYAPAIAVVTGPDQD